MAYFLILGGLSSSTAFDATVALSGLMLIGNMFGWIFVERFGRRGTALWGKGSPFLLTASYTRGKVTNK